MRRLGESIYPEMSTLVVEFPRPHVRGVWLTRLLIVAQLRGEVGSKPSAARFLMGSRLYPLKYGGGV